MEKIPYLNSNNCFSKKSSTWTRRRFLKATVAGGAALAGGALLGHLAQPKETKTEVFIARVHGYNHDIRKIILNGLAELSIKPASVEGKRVLLKPNLVEPYRGYEHINTHPLIIRGVAEAFLTMGASEIVVAEAAGHMRDTLIVLEQSGFSEILVEDKIPFIDLNECSASKIKNLGKTSQLEHLYFPEEVLKADIVVSVAKMKTHHWASVTLSMKNLFGIMPGIVYGWPKNVLHWAGLQECIFDITATLKPHLAIVDGIVGMEGDGPIMGAPIHSNVIVIGKNLPAVDATCARIMGITPQKIGYLKHSSGRIGAIEESNIEQRGEKIQSVRTNYQLIEYIPAHKEIRLEF
jgi:uncharacterized protein (DUF362 family)